MGVVVAIFDFGKIDGVVFGGDDVDFVKESFVIVGYDFVVLLLEIGDDGLLGLLASMGGVFLRCR